MNFGPQTASNWRLVFTHLCNFCIPLHCQASQTEISKHNSTKLCQTVGGKPRQQSAVEELGLSLPKKWGPKTFTFVRFSTTSRRNGEYLLKEDKRARALESRKGLLRCPEISWTLVHKGLKTGPEFLPTLTILSPHSDSK